MSTTTNVPQVKLNIMTQQQYNTATKNPTELYMVTDAQVSYNDLANLPDPIQVSTVPTAASTNVGQIIQYTGTTTSTYTKGYFYICTASGSPVTYSWTRIDVQPAGGSSLPSQTGQSGKFLTTDGTDASWANIPNEIPTQSGNSGKFLTTNGSVVSWATVSGGSLPSQTGNAGKFLTTDGTNASWGEIAAYTANEVETIWNSI